MKLLWSLIEARSRTRNPYLILFYSKIISFFLFFSGSSIASAAKFANRPTFPHGITGVHISSGASIGKNAVIFQQVTIGSNTLADSKHYGAPSIGDNCYIGAGAKIIGNVTVGNNVRIGANAVVVDDIPDHTIVVSQPVRLIHKESLDNHFYPFDSNKVQH
ncbi:serine acetyltransferase [Ignavigranum ruoffiae]|uniref:Serine acetyltransferase n=1 Tax=Ignavigranum ruoffiae TaxID=89093 RepID=A0A1H9CQ01_9LACT|nr:serine acetyltransferase [Ignavigranum ruoffiae]UPQ86664.1 serine acetyltransferase [Ignavigranum ruoffiae]SEQ03296.1 serine O-acetyltransferase [Ignavigranum ruoffiae]